LWEVPLVLAILAVVAATFALAGPGTPLDPVKALNSIRP